MKIDAQTVATTFATRLGKINRRVMSAKSEGGYADLEVPGALIRVAVDQHLQVAFFITDEEAKKSHRELIEMYLDPSIQAIIKQVDTGSKDYIVTSPFPHTPDSAQAESNGVNVMATVRPEDGRTYFSLEVLLGTFSI